MELVRRAEPWYRLAEWTLRPPLALWFNWRFEGLEHIPLEGPVLVACNHISYLDPLAHGYMLVKAGRRPRFLAKSELYGNPFLCRLLEGTRQIKVERGSGSMAPVEEAKRALREGEVVMVYPEATITRNPDHTPMEGKTGVARITLSAEVPVLPMAVWGSQHVWQREGRGSLEFGRPIWVKAGVPLDFSQFEGEKDNPATLRKTTNTVMDELTRLVADLRARYPKRWSQ
jgi:1-acyl-sn-glycerol-3-phosphate acyltransferase